MATAVLVLVTMVELTLCVLITGRLVPMWGWLNAVLAMLAAVCCGVVLTLLWIVWLLHVPSGAWKREEKMIRGMPAVTGGRPGASNNGGCPDGAKVVGLPEIGEGQIVRPRTGSASAYEIGTWHEVERKGLGVNGNSSCGSPHGTIQGTVCVGPLPTRCACGVCTGKKGANELNGQSM